MCWVSFLNFFGFVFIMFNQRQIIFVMFIVVVMVYVFWLVDYVFNLMCDIVGVMMFVMLMVQKLCIGWFMGQSLLVSMEMLKINQQIVFIVIWWLDFCYILMENVMKLILELMVVILLQMFVSVGVCSSLLVCCVSGLQFGVNMVVMLVQNRNYGSGIRFVDRRS